MAEQLLFFKKIVAAFFRRSRSGFRPSGSRFLAISSVMLVLILNHPAIALEGPVEVLPLGCDVSDSDPGGPDDKEQWGRAGGRTFEFTVYEVDEYSELKWQPLDVGLAFDGAIDEQGETLILDFIMNGTSVWIGSTTVEVLDEDTNTYEDVAVNTQFILTVKQIGGSLAPLEIMDSLPAVNVKTLPLAFFSATLEMMAQMPPYDSVTAICPYTNPTVGDDYPALDVFDCLQTNPAHDRPAISRFEYGFFYEMSTSGTDLWLHDAKMETLVGNVQGSVDEIYTWTRFLFEDWPARWQGITDAKTEINDKLAILDTDLNNVGTKIDVIGSKVDTCAQQAMLDDVKDIVKLDPDWHLLMFGLQDFIQDETLKQYVPAVLASSPLYQKLDANSQGISDALEQCGQNTESLNDMSTQMQQYADIIASLTSQLQEANQTIEDLNAAMASMYTQEELDQAVADTCPGHSETHGKPGPRKKTK